MKKWLLIAAVVFSLLTVTVRLFGIPIWSVTLWGDNQTTTSTATDGAGDSGGTF